MLYTYQRMRRLFLFISIGMLALSIISCASREKLVYLQPDDSLLNAVDQQSKVVLQEGDILSISVTSENVKATLPFNPVSPYLGNNVSDRNVFIPTYTIDDNGDINFPKLGKVHLAGMTRIEAINFMEGKISDFVRDPGVDITVRNFRVTVLGEVKNPGSIEVTDDRITILEALGQAGDLTIHGIRDNVLVVREKDGKRQEYRVDLTKNSLLNSPVYYLNQNDVVYVEPNGAQRQSSKHSASYSVFVSVASLLISVIAVLAR